VLYYTANRIGLCFIVVNRSVYIDIEYDSRSGREVTEVIF